MGLRVHVKVCQRAGLGEAVGHDVEEPERLVDVDVLEQFGYRVETDDDPVVLDAFLEFFEPVGGANAESDRKSVV